MSDLKDRFRKCREASGLTQEQLSELSGISQEAISKIESGLTKRPRNLKKFAELFKVSPVWLEYENGEEPSLEVKDVYKITKIPLFERDGLIKWGSEIFDKEMDHKEIIVFYEMPPTTFAYILDTDSMYTPYSDLSFVKGEVIIVDLCSTITPGCFVLARNQEKNSLLFRQYLEEDGKIYLKALNEKIPNQIIEAKDYEIIGVCIKSIMEKNIPPYK